jgi:hypothetical protein
VHPIDGIIELLCRQEELESAMRRPGGVRIIQERSLLALRDQLKAYPESVRAVLGAAHSLNRPVTSLSARDVEAWVGTSQ